MMKHRIDVGKFRYRELSVSFHAEKPTHNMTNKMEI